MLRGHVPAFREALDHLRLRPEQSPSTPTPRLSQLGFRLATGHRIEQLAEVIIDSPGIRCILGDIEAHRLLGFLSLSDDTEEHGTEAIDDPSAWSGESRHPAPPPTPVQGDLHLEVLGGPEDGRLLTLPPGSVLGRWDQGEAEAGPGRLHGPPGPESTRVSRGHARYLGRGAVQLEASARLIRGRTSEDHRVRRRTADSLPVELQLFVGDLLLLDVALKGAGVWLRVVGPVTEPRTPE
jgi:hypothetical protein